MRCHTFILIWAIFCSGKLTGQVVFELLEEEGDRILQVLLPEDDRKRAGQMPEALLQVYVGELDPGEDRPPVLGNYSLLNDHLVFQPLFPFREGLTYTAWYDSSERYTFTIPLSEDRPVSTVAAIFPSADTLPANLLKLYLHFSTPMSEGHAYDYIMIIDEAGDTLEQSFVPLYPELWNSDRRRLTLWLDPGRVKRDLGPNQWLGPPIEEGIHYRIIVDKDWQNAFGQPLEKDFESSFYAGPADRQKPVTGTWTLTVPSALTRQALRIDFGESLDRELLLHDLEVWSKNNSRLSGEIHIGVEEQSWEFRPQEPWGMGPYQIRVAARLEDLAGNNLNRLFDRDVEDPLQEAADEEYYWLEFTIRKE